MAFSATLSNKLIIHVVQPDTGKLSPDLQVGLDLPIPCFDAYDKYRHSYNKKLIGSYVAYQMALISMTLHDFKYHFSCVKPFEVPYPGKYRTY